jgi:site-specific recombinase
MRDLFTERDGVSFCIGRILGAAAIVEMIVKFSDVNHVDYSAFAQGVAIIVGAIAVKNFSEKDNVTKNDN